LSAVLLDTHAWAWLLSRDKRLSRGAVDVGDAADVVWLSPISFFEIGQKVRLGKWPQMAPFANGLAALLEAQGGKIAAVGSAIATRAANLDWTHRDPFDRLIAATAIELKVELVSADAAFDALAAETAWRRRVW
jgi:PIN domain nuclease of toxin-antitoxin system